MKSPGLGPKLVFRFRAFRTFDEVLTPPWAARSSREQNTITFFRINDAEEVSHSSFACVKKSFNEEDLDCHLRGILKLLFYHFTVRESSENDVVPSNKKNI